MELRYSAELNSHTRLLRAEEMMVGRKRCGKAENVKETDTRTSFFELERFVTGVKFGA